MNLNLFSFENYKDYLGERIKLESREQKGFRTNLCEEIGCQSSYLSQILNGKPDLTLEQANKVNRLFKHDKDETKYFILLVEHSRAGSHDLKDFFQEQLRELREVRFNLQKRLKGMVEITPEDQSRYYSAWYYSAIHVYLSTICEQDPKVIAERFNLSYELVLNVLHFLEASGMIEKKEGRFIFTKRSFHLGRDSQYIHNHHINWRSQALQSVEKNYVTDLHYSTVVTLNPEHFAKLKEIYLQAVEQGREVIKASPETDVYTITLDIFRT